MQESKVNGLLIENGAVVSRHANSTMEREVACPLVFLFMYECRLAHNNGVLFFLMAEVGMKIIFTHEL